MSRRTVAVALVAGAALAGVSSAAVSVNVKLTVTVVGQGTVTSAPKGIVCPKACAKAFAKGKSLKLTAKAKARLALHPLDGSVREGEVGLHAQAHGGEEGGSGLHGDSSAPPPPPPTFTPQTLAGNWNGTWRNETFGSSGSARIVLTVTSPTTFTFTSNFGGNVFGCSSPPDATGTVTQGTGPNTWNADGFNVDITTPIGGKVVLAYVFASSSLTGNGRSGCNPDITWRMASGTFAGNTFNGRIEIFYQGSPFATSVLSLTRG